MYIGNSIVESNRRLFSNKYENKNDIFLLFFYHINIDVKKLNKVG